MDQSPQTPPPRRRIPEKKEVITPKVQDLVLFDEKTGEPFVFTAKQQEYFTQQGFATIPNKTPVRRRINEIERYDGKEPIKVVCLSCGRSGKVVQDVTDADHVYCEECFEKAWNSHLAANPEYAAEFAAADAAADAELERLRNQ